jgi:cystathionine beta-lyase
MYDFNKIIDRKQSYSKKWRKYAGKDILPLWVADMDFTAPPAVLAALQRTLEHGIFGYSMHQEEVRRDIVDSLQREYNWGVVEKDIIWLPGLVCGLNLASQALSDVDQPIITATPVYPPFMSAPLNAGRELLKTPLLEVNGDWRWNWEDLEKQLAAARIKPKLLLLCNPHNPVGKMWTREELEQLLEFVIRHDLVVCSDEIHCDLVLDENRKHIPFASISKEAAERSITLMAPSKTYNVAGLNCSFAIATNPLIRNKFAKIMRGLFGDLNSFGVAACQAAYNECEDWKNALLVYLRANRDLIVQTLAPYPDLQLTIPEATYLLWIDGRKLCAKYNIENLQQFFEQAGVGLSDGAEFDLPGFVRLNFGTSRVTLTQALERMVTALNQLKEQG